MKRMIKAFACLSLVAACAVGAAACGQTHSNLTEDGWEEIIEYAEELETYRVILTLDKEGEDLISATYESDPDRSEPRAHYEKLGNSSGTLINEYIMMDSDRDTFRYTLEGGGWKKRNVTPSGGEKDEAFDAFQDEYDPLPDLFNVTYYPEGNSDGVDLEDLYEYLTYSHGNWVGDMAFKHLGTLCQGSVKVEYMADSIESFRANKKGLLFRLTLSTTVDGARCAWTYDIQSWTSGFITTLPTYAEFVD